MTNSEREREFTFANKTDVLRYVHLLGVTNGYSLPYKLTFATLSVMYSGDGSANASHDASYAERPINLQRTL